MLKKKSKSVTIVYKRSMSSTIYNVNFRTAKNFFFYSFCRHFSLMTSSENRTGLTVSTASGSCHVLALNFGRVAATRSIRCVADVA